MPRQTLDDRLLNADLSNSPTRIQIRVEQRHAFSLAIYFETADEHRINIDGCSITMAASYPVHLRKTELAIYQVAEIVDYENGHARFDLQAVDLDLPAGSYEFDVSIRTNENYSNSVTKGFIEVVANPHPGYVEEVYDIFNPAYSLTAKIQDNYTVAVVVNHLSGLVLEAGTVTVLPPGEPATARITGDYPFQVLELGLPTFEGPGPKGEDGAPGVAGTRWGSTNAWLVSGTLANQVVSFPDGGPPRVGDLVTTANGFEPGAVYAIAAVVDATHADLKKTSPHLNIRGPKGADGAGGAGAYTHVQGTAAAVWTIDHGLSFLPNVAVVDSTGRAAEGDVVYTDADTVTITFSAAFSGKAYLS
jgi:hypothetical protein